MAGLRSKFAARPARLRASIKQVIVDVVRLAAASTWGRWRRSECLHLHLHLYTYAYAAHVHLFQNIVKLRLD